MAKSIGRYEIREELGRGGMAVVYRAIDPKLQRDVALKLMDQQLSADPSFAARFEREARTVAALEHTAIVSLYDFGEVDGWLYLVMPYMRGGSLKESIAKGPLTTRDAYNVVRRISGALDKAHSRGVIHRDLKPANILLDEEREAYLSDFGIVKMAAGDTEYLTETGQTIGTFAYMSPEQVMGEALNHRSDIYALGLLLYEMLVGSHPYGQAGTSGAMAVAQTQKPVPNIRESNPALPAACQGVINKAMAKDPAQRYASGREMALALYEALSGKPAVQQTKPVTAVPDRPAVQPQRQQPATQPQVRQPAVQPAPAQAEPAASQHDAKQSPVAARPLPTPIVVLGGLLTILTALSIGGLIPGFRVSVYYWLGIGLLAAASLLSRPADWRWRVVVAVLGVLTALYSIIIGFWV